MDGHAVPDGEWHRRKPAALLKLLALAPAHRLHREQVTDALWPDLEPVAAGANLRKALHYARQAVDPDDAPSVIASDADLLRLVAGDVWVDLTAFRAAVATARRERDPDSYRDAIDLYREGLLPEDRYEVWAETPREDARSEYVGALAEYAALLEADGDVDAAFDAVHRLVEADPLREESHATLIRLHALAGRRAEAMREYERLRDLLDTELGVEPAPDTQRLYEEVRARQSGEPELSGALWERVGDLRVLSGDALGAARAYATAADAEGGDEVSARLERKCADAWLLKHRPDAAAPHLRNAEKYDGGPAERGRLYRTEAHHAWETGEIEAARRFATAARDLAAAHGTADDLAGAYEALAVVAHFTGEWRDGLTAELDRLAADDAGPAPLARVFDLHHCIGQYHLYGDALSGSVEDYARRLLDRAEDAGAVRAQAFAWCLLGESLLLQARWDESAGCLERACDLHASLGSRTGALPWQRRAELAVCTGAPADAAAYLRQAAAISTVSPMARHLWGRIHATYAFSALEQGDPARAERAVRNAAAAAARYGDCPTCDALLNPMAAEAYTMLGDPESARPYVEAAARVGEMFDSSAWRAMAESAAGHADAASALYFKAGQPYWAERSARGNAQGTPRT